MKKYLSVIGFEAGKSGALDPLPLFFTTVIPYSSKLLKNKTFTNFVVLEPLVKVFSSKMGMPYPPMLELAFSENFLHEMVTLADPQFFFSLESF